MLKKGDPCYVRNHYGEIEECRYGHVNGMVHTVYDKSGGIIKISRFKPKDIWSGRFVCMTGLNNAQQQSLGLKVKER